MIEDVILRLIAAGVPLFGAVALFLFFVAIRALLHMRPANQDPGPTEYSQPLVLPSRPTRPADIAGILIIAGSSLTLMLTFGVGLVRRVASMDGHEAMWLTTSSGQVLIISIPIVIMTAAIAVLWRSAILTWLAVVGVIFLAAYPAPMLWVARCVYRALAG